LESQVITNPQIGDRFRAMDNHNDYEVVMVHAHQVVLKSVTLRLASVYELTTYYHRIEAGEPEQLVA
jgi:hypothetical protein